MNNNNNNNDNTNNNRLVSLLKSVLVDKGEDISCGDCDEEVARYVDMLQLGEDPAALLPHIKMHLECCGGCKEQMEALVVMVESQAKDNEDSA